MNHEMLYLESHIGSMSDAVEVINKFEWNIKVTETTANKHVIYGGDQAIYWSDTKEGVEAFLYGMALAYSVLVGLFGQKLIDEVKELTGG